MNKWITYELKNEPKEIAIFKQYTSSYLNKKNIKYLLCIIVRKKLQKDWTEGQIYKPFKYGNFISTNSLGNLKKCICRNSTKKEIELAKEVMIINKL